MAVKHSDGPWSVDKNTKGDVNGADGRDVAVTLYSGMTRIEISGSENTLAAITREQAEANARLIAAAPDLLAALIDCREALRVMDCIGELRVVDAAIAKAIGEQQ